MSQQMATLLRDTIRASGLSAAKLSELTGVTQPTITEFLRGKDLRLATAQKLADHFGLVLKKSR